MLEEKTCVFDVCLNWTQLLDTYKNNPPPLSFIKNKGSVAQKNKNTVIIKFDKKFDDFLEIHDWLFDQDYKYQMFGQFTVEKGMYETRVFQTGMKYSFENHNDCCLFLLMWGGYSTC